MTAYASLQVTSLLCTSSLSLYAYLNASLTARDCFDSKNEHVLIEDSGESPLDGWNSFRFCTAVRECRLGCVLNGTSCTLEYLMN